MKKVGGMTELLKNSLSSMPKSPEAEHPEAVQDEGNFQQVTIRVDAESVRVLSAYAEQEGIKRNRLFDEAIQLYAVMLKGGKRTK